MTYLFAAYFTTIIVYCLYYFIQSFSLSGLPWATCANQTWSRDNCIDVTMEPFNGSEPVTQEFFDNNLLHKTSGIEEFGILRPNMAIMCIITWILMYLSIFKGAKVIGKVVYLTVVFPYFILVALLIRGATLPGAFSGIEYYLGLNGKGDWSRITDVQVWVAATSQIFFSLGIGLGSLIAFSSYNTKNTTLLRDTFVIGLGNSCSSLLAGFLVFSVLGHISHIVGRPVGELATAGPELIFVSIPQALSSMNPGWLWSALFFLTLFLLGINSIFATVEAGNAALIDFLQKKGKKVKRELLAAGVCALLCMISLLTMFDGGIYLYKLLDWYVATQSLALLASFEMITICWIYTPRRLSEAVQSVTGTRPPKIFQWMWISITPCLVLTIMVFSVTGIKRITYQDYNYPDWCIALGWCIAMCSVVWIPIMIIIELRATPGSSLLGRLRQAIKPRIQCTKDTFQNSPSSTMDSVSIVKTNLLDETLMESDEIPIKI